jgi:hypothetical protein
MDEPTEYRRDIGDGRSIWLRRQLFNYILIIGPTDAPCYTDDW